MRELVDSTMDRIIQECKAKRLFLGTVAREVIRKKHIARSLADLESENARLREEVKRLEKADETRVKDISRLTIERDAARDRLAEALKALEPFAEQADNPQWWNEGMIGAIEVTIVDDKIVKVEIDNV